MKNQAILTLLIDQQEVLKVAPDKLSPRGCEFECSNDELVLLREQGEHKGRYRTFKIRLGLFPHSGPCPQYIIVSGQVTSLRRCSQQVFRVFLSFHDVPQNGYRLIAEHISAPLVEPISLQDSIKSNKIISEFPRMVNS